MIATVMAPDADGIDRDTARAFSCGADAVEIRFDAAPGVTPEQVGRTAKGPLLATCRPVSQGGGFAGHEAERVEVLRSAAETGRYLLDVEMGSLAEERLSLSPESVAIVSHHDVRETPAQLAALARWLLGAAKPGQIAKLVPTARSVGDALRIRDTLRSLGSTPLACFAMGERGRLTRILSGVWGSSAIWAAASAEAPGASGQIPLEELLGPYRFRSIGSGTALYGIVGSPVRGSLSPAIHNDVFSAERIDAVYLPLDCPSAPDAVRLMKELPLRGVSVTAPLKVEMLSFLTSCDRAVERVRACNTVQVRGESGGAFELHGSNTDLGAILDEIRQRIDPSGRLAIVLGAGGAARAAALALSEAGARVVVAARDPAALRTLGREIGVETASLDEVRGHPRGILVQATSASADAQLLAPERLEAAFALDMRYGPEPTRFLMDAARARIEAVDGSGMLVRQAREQVHLFTGRQVSLENLDRSVRRALQRRSGSGGPVRSGDPHSL